MQTKTPRTESTNSGQSTLERMLADAMDHSVMQVLGAMTPREYVALRTMSPFEIGCRFKQLLRDETYERRREAMKRQRNGVTTLPSR